MGKVRGKKIQGREVDSTTVFGWWLSAKGKDLVQKWSYYGFRLPPQCIVPRRQALKRLLFGSGHLPDL